jgi:hypothetical protein
MTIPDIRIAAPTDPGSAVFDEHGTPLLVFGRHPERGGGWTLHYLDENGDPDQHANGSRGRREHEKCHASAVPAASSELQAADLHRLGVRGET